MKAILRKPRLLIGVLLLIGLLAAGLLFLRPSDANTSVAFETEVARIGDISASVEATGTVRAYQTAIYTWQTSGTVESIGYELGDMVQADDMLASLEKTSLPAEIYQAEADLVRAKRELEDLLGTTSTEAANAAIALREAQEAYDEAVNYRELLDSEVEYDTFTGVFIRLATPFGTFRIPKINNIRYMPSDEQKAEAEQDIALQQALLDDAQRAYDRIKDGPTQRDISAVEAKILAAEIVLEQANIFATFDGTITKIDAKVNDRVTSGQEAFRVDDLSTLVLDLSVSEIDINNVSLGQKVSVDFDAINEKSYTGEVTDIAVTSSTSASGTGYAVTVQLLDNDDLIKPGMTAEIFIQVREAKNALLIPNQALRLLDGERVVYLLKGENEPVPTIIRLGLRSDDYSQIVGGDVDAGDLIVLNPPVHINQ